MTIIAKCSCSHRGQDELHGPGRRAMNWSPKNRNYRCTVCRATVFLSAPKK